MKKQIQVIQFFLIATLFTLGLSATANNNVTSAKTYSMEANCSSFNNHFSYSWTVEPSAVTYQLNIVNSSTQESFSWNTSQTSVSAFSVPNGVYNLTLTATFADGSSSIIVVDVIEH